MSQAKVDKYKNEKANRKKTNARNKVKRVIARIVAAAAVVALVGWGGYSTQISVLSAIIYRDYLQTVSSRLYF